MSNLDEVTEIFSFYWSGGSVETVVEDRVYYQDGMYAYVSKEGTVRLTRDREGALSRAGLTDAEIEGLVPCIVWEDGAAALFAAAK